MLAPVELDGHSLSISDVVAVARQRAPVKVAKAALQGMVASRRTVEAAVARGDTVYGVTTGFGKLAHVRIPAGDLRRLQLNLIRSHASGVGDPRSEEADSGSPTPDAWLRIRFSCSRRRSQAGIRTWA